VVCLELHSLERFGDFSWRSALSSVRARLLSLASEHCCSDFEMSFTEESLNDSTLDRTELNWERIGSSSFSSSSFVSGSDSSRPALMLLE